MSQAPAIYSIQQAASLHQSGRLDEAAQLYRALIEQDPRHFDAHHLLGVVMMQKGDYEEGATLIRQALEIVPGNPAALSNLGNALAEQKLHEEALTCYEQALTVQPQMIKALVDAANILQALQRHDEARTYLERALVTDPKRPDLYLHHGMILRLLGRNQDALQAFEQARRLNPGLPLIDGLHLHLKMTLSDWQDYDVLTEALRQKVRQGQAATTPFSFLALPSSSTEQRQAASTHVTTRHPPQSPLWTGEKYNHKKIRLAYLSADYHDHATTHLMAGLFEHHDRKTFELTAISFGRADNTPFRQRLEKSFDHFIDVRHMSDMQVAQMLREREIDIAVDLKGFTQDARCDILAYRPAPVQVNYLGYPGTMGAPYIDYIIADPVVIPPDHQQFYSEKIVCLRHSYQVNDRNRVIAEQTPTRANCGLPDDAFVFCCFNNNYKITPDIFDIWMRLLQTVPGSVLWLYEKYSEATQNMKREAEKRGVSSDRLVFARKMPLADHLARHRLADLFLDTLPYNAHTTASDALWAGLPVLTCQGDTFASRVAASLLSAVNLPELITTSLVEYESQALELARDTQKLTAIKTKLKDNRDTCPLFDTALFTQHLESAYKAMWQRYQDGLMPEIFDI